MTILNASLVTDDGEAVDTQPLFEKGVPTMANSVYDNQSHDFYFRYHHSAGDSMLMMNPDDLDSNVVGVATMFYILADLESTIPRPPATHLKSE
jgi:carboxypeptidase Q